ncbi:hypothetical protein B5M09_005025 [Aphanomyces astaci]|uniref:Uncharacterized protein n=1 Tax=Aphanomyces astaci TaxID=112090 RepID=A0A425D0Z2_APHAT|nr:hypothetical protein B5M09_005025 [Aphanomyces astaci]
MEGTPVQREGATTSSKPKVLWSSAKKAKRQKTDHFSSAEKENANAAQRNMTTQLDVLNEDEVVQVEANLHGDFDSIKLPRWLRKRREMLVGSVLVDYPRRVSSVSRALYQADTPTKDDFYVNVLASHPSQSIVACATLQDVVLYRATGARRTTDSTLAHHDVRLRQPTLPTRSHGHDQEVCGLAYAGNGTTLASGGNDNVVNLWDLKQAHQPMHRLMEHCAAVKALAWCPWEASLLATGGGTADKSIKLWNSHTGMLLQSKTTHAQVSALVWSNPASGNKFKELLSAHGFQSPAMTLWSYPSMQKIRSFTTRSGRMIRCMTDIGM